MRLLLFALVVGACRDLDDGLTDIDADGDGVLAGDDCNDADISVFPGAVELCNGIDDDCNSVVDDISDGTGTAFYTDLDGDGYGEGDPVWACQAFDGVAMQAGDCDDLAADVYPGAPEPDCTDDVDRNCDGSVGFVDEDGDGFAACEECDDTDADVNPRAVERCNGVDDDCNLAVDDDAVDAPTWYLDGDRDGFGDPEAPARACRAPQRHVASDDDCNDAVATVHPGAEETCDGVDQDCDDAVDEGATDAPTWYVDADRDGHGGDVTLQACTAPEGFVALGDDCNDLDAAAFPGADETCNGQDDDCDRQIDEGAIDATVWFADPDGDTWGDAQAGSESACTAPDGYVDRAGDCAERDPLRYPGAPERCNGLDDDCDRTVDEDAVDRQTFYADADGDGYGNPLFTTLACTLPRNHADNDEDCDDARSAAFPGADETCNRLDDDCDLEVDEDAVDPLTWYPDGDRDGWGVDRGAIEACQGPRDFVRRSGDCAADDPTIHPQAPETCNGVDDDCDRAIDEDATDARTWYADVDGDGYAGDRLVQAACDQPDGFLATFDDCDDLDRDIHPGARDICGDDIDQDCDGVDTTGANGETPECAATSCAEVLEVAPRSPDGPYYIDATGTDPVYAWCDLSGGGWMLGFTKNSADTGLYHDFGLGYVGLGALAVHPAATSNQRGGVAGWVDLNEASYDELRIHAYARGVETYRSEPIARESLRIDFGQDGYFLYGEHGYYWCGGTHAYTDNGVGQVNRPPGAPADCKGHGSLGSGWDFSHVDRTNQGLTLCGYDYSRWMHEAYGGSWITYPNVGASQAIWIR